MKFDVTAEWLTAVLAECSDVNVGAGGTSPEQFKKDVERRTVTPAVLAHVPTELGKVVRYVREQKGWTRAELAELADIDEVEVESLETRQDYDPSPRTVTQLADTCRFSRARFINLARHKSDCISANDDMIKFAAKSKSTETVTDDEYEAVRVLVEILSSKD